MKGYHMVGVSETFHRASSLVFALVLLGGVASCGRPV